METLNTFVNYSDFDINLANIIAMNTLNVFGDGSEDHDFDHDHDLVYYAICFVFHCKY